jgi:hypothetical protein
VPLIAQRNDRYLRSPELELRDGVVLLRAIAWTKDGEHVYEATLAADGTLAGEVLGEASPAVVALGSRGRAESRASDDAHAVPGARVWIEREGYVSRVMVALGGGDPVRVWEAPATAAAPHVLPVLGGAWVAFHHNLREDRGEVDLAKWIAVRFVGVDGSVRAPSAQMTGRNRDQEGEEQSFEFPVLAAGPDGALMLLGRGSHSHWRQELSSRGWSPRMQLGEGVWGCRGRRVAAVDNGAGALLTARRAKGGIELEVVPFPAGGAPALVITDVVQRGPAPAVHDRSAAESFARADGRLTLFGDVHQHSAHSDGIGSADEPYLRARHLYGDDFCALTDHESFLGKRIGPGEWKYLESVAEKHNDPGSFATLLAFEWTGRSHPGPGHKVVYLPKAGLPVFSRDVLTTGKELLAALRECGGFAVPHHVGWTGADEGAHDPGLQPVWEICSCHGCYESWKHELGQRGDLREQMVDAVLARGHRFGFIASSDGHGLLWHHGVARKRDPFRTGLCAVQATERTRGAILEAMRARRTYATSGVKILLDVRVNGAPMGADVPRAERAQVHARVRGAAELGTVEVVGPRGVVARLEPRDLQAELKAEVAAPGAFLYVRVRQTDGEMAWSSPVFFG